VINNVVLVGRLTKDPDLRYTPNGVAVVTFTLAVNRNFTNQSGNREADFINCVLWRKPAEALANFARKGALIGVEGRIQTRNYENQQGQKVYVTEVVCENFQMLESKTVSEQRRQESGTGNMNQQFNPSSNQSSSSYQNDMSQGNLGRDTNPFGAGSQIDISDDDLPF